MIYFISTELKITSNNIIEAPELEEAMDSDDLVPMVS